MLIALLPGDGIGPEVVAGARRVLDAVCGDRLQYEEAPVGAAGYRAAGHPLPPETLQLAARAGAILFGAVGDPSCDVLPRHLRPEQAILGLRKALGLWANLRPATVFAGMEDASALRPEVTRGLDLVIVRELTGDVYFGEPRGRRETATGLREGFDTMRYDEAEVRRIAVLGFEMARRRRKRLCSVDKANVLETSQLWRDVVNEVAGGYQDVSLEHMYVDNAAMQLVRAPAHFDVVITGNLFGDILSDQASMCTGSIGLLPSASLRDWQGALGLYEPIHGSAPDIAGQGKANPVAAILSAAMMLRHSFGLEAEAARIEAAVAGALRDGARTADLGGTLGTDGMTEAVLAALG